MIVGTVSFLVGLLLGVVVCVFRYKGAAIAARREGFNEGEACGFNALHLQQAGRAPTMDELASVERIRYTPWSVERARDEAREDREYAGHFDEAHARHDIP